MKSPRPAELDIRPLCAAQLPPLAAILTAVNQLQPGQALRLIVPFQPQPLYDLLGRRGFAQVTRKRKDGAWDVTFRQPPQPSAADDGINAP